MSLDAPLWTLEQAEARSAGLLEHFSGYPDILSPDEQALAMVIAARDDKVEELETELARVAGILRKFLEAPVTASALQPVFDLGVELNPDIHLCSMCRRKTEGGTVCSSCRDRSWSQR